jgi:hypothetical protein
MNPTALPRRSLAAFAVLLAFLCAAPGALAAVRHASPTGTGSTCDAGTPCDVVTAVNGAGANDEVILASGNYGSEASPITTQLAIDDANLVVHGAAGAQRPVLFTATAATQAVRLSAAGAQLRDVEIRMSANHTAVFVTIGLAERIVATSSAGDAPACQIGAQTLRNSICLNTSTASGGVAAQVLIQGTGTGTMRNVTAISTAPAGIGVRVRQSSSSSNATATLNATNVIAQAAADATARDASAVTVAASTFANLNLANSNYDTQDETGPGTEDVTDPGTGTGNQMTPPVLGADFRQVTGSPTIDAGVNDAANGTLDFEGDARTIGSSTDIGADEFVPTASSSGGSGSAAGGTAGAGTGAGATNVGGLLAPSNVFSFGKFNPLTGEWVINVPGPGGLVAEDAATVKKTEAAARKRKKKKRKKAALIKIVKTTATKAGPVRLKLTLSKAGKAKLRKSGRVAVTVRVTYTPTGGTARSTSKRIIFKVRRKKKKKR